MIDVARTSIATRTGQVAALRAAVPTRAALPAASVLPAGAAKGSPGPPPAPGVIVAHDAWGLDDELADLVATLARAGFVALAPDLVEGRLAGDTDEAAAVAAGIDAEDASLVLAAATDALAADPQVRGGPLGAVGLGIGAPLAAFLATIRPEIGVVVLAGPAPDLQLEAWGRAEADLVVLADPDDDGTRLPGGRHAPGQAAEGTRDDDGDAGDTGSLDRAAAAGRHVERVALRSGEDRADAIARALVARLGA